MPSANYNAFKDALLETKASAELMESYKLRLKHLLKESFVLRKTYCFLDIDVSRGYTAQKLEEIGFSLSELKDAGYTAQEMRAAGYSVQEAYDAGYEYNEMRSAGYTW